MADKIPTAEFEFIDPERARQFLAANMRNRNPNPHREDAYARQMGNDEWLVTHQGIAFDWNGEMLDGQQRCAAIIKSGTTQYVLVVRNLNPDVRHVIDTGRPRSASDTLGISGFTYATKRAAMGKVAILWAEGAYRTTKQQYVCGVSNLEVLTWAAENSADADAALSLATKIHRAGFPTPSVGVLAAVLLILKRIDPDDDRMFERMRNRTLHGAGDPLYALNSRIEQSQAQKKPIPHPGLLHLYFSAWNDIRQGKRRMAYKLGDAGANGVIRIAQPE